MRDEKKNSGENRSSDSDFVFVLALVAVECTTVAVGTSASYEL